MQKKPCTDQGARLMGLNDQSRLVPPVGQPVAKSWVGYAEPANARNGGFALIPVIEAAIGGTATDFVVPRAPSGLRFRFGARIDEGHSEDRNST